MDQQLPAHKRIGIKFHLMMCILCRRYQKQLLSIRSIISRDSGTEEALEGSLPADVRKRIEKKINDEI